MKDKNIAIFIFIIIIFTFQIFSFLYLVNTRPRIEFIPDIEDKNYKWGRYKTDSYGSDYPYLRIYHKDFFLNADTHINLLQRLFEPSNYWEGRITDMDIFLVNYGWRKTGSPLFDELSIDKRTIVEMKFEDILPFSTLQN